MKYFLLLFAFLAILVSCQKEEITPPEDGLSLEQQMNEFIEEQMKDIYLWADEDDVKNRDIDIDQDPSDFLAAMMYEKDSWSYLETNEELTKSSIDGTEMTFGYKIKFWNVRGLSSLIGIIQYVYPNTPAANAGLKRGDMIVMNNGELLDENNFSKVMTDSKVSLKMGEISNSGLDVFEEEYELSVQRVELNPILLDTILEIEHKRVGYLVYSQFIDNGNNSLSDLSKVIGKMEAESIDDFILDLRYNMGGRVSAAVHLASLLAPANAVQNSEVLIHKHWNKKYQQQYQNNLKDYFDPSVLADNLDLSKIYILTGEWTASASEIIISGLTPYILVITIGEKTLGKYAGMSQRLPKEELQKWTLWPVTFTYTNARGEDVKGGIAPTITVGEYYNKLPPFGSLADPLLAKAIELTSGGQPVVASVQTRSQKMTDSWKLLEEDNKYLLIDK